MADTDQAQSLRQSLLDQLAMLVEEVEGMRMYADRIPVQLLIERPTPDTLAIIEVYAFIAHLDERVRRPAAEMVQSGAFPRIRSREALDVANEHSWAEGAFEDTLDRVKQAREQLVESLRAGDLDTWGRNVEVDSDEMTVFDWTHRILQNDTERLRTVAQRLHHAHLSDREEDLPK